MSYHYSPSEFASTDSQAIKTVISRTESTQYLVLDSKNRNYSAQPGASTSSQPWNKFRLQRPQALMQSFATRVLVSEVRFPWYVPNITKYNNSLYFKGENSLAVDIVVTVTLPPKFYQPADIVTAVNQQLTASSLVAPPVLSYDPVLQTYTFTYPSVPEALASQIYWFDSTVSPTAPPQSVFESSSSLAKTLGFEWSQVNGSNPNISGKDRTGNPTESLYTQYIDIVSEKLNYYTHQKDGSSDPLTSQALICRLYIADEVSLAQNTTPIGPFVIHRQYKTPKAIMWNKEAVVDWLDVAVYDEFGQLIPLPDISFGGSVGEALKVEGAYPNFQITLLATEN